MVWNFERRWRFILQYHDEHDEIVSVISDIDNYLATKNKYDRFIKSLSQAELLIFGRIVAEL
jgi:hypothetical protein